MNKGRKKNKSLREYIRVNWKRMTDAKMSNNQDYDCTPERVQKIRVSMGFKRTKEHLQRMYNAVREGRYPPFPKRGYQRRNR